MTMQIPLGIEFFSEMRESGYYYVDKTGLIKELLSQNFKASLITRPRRFGKSLTISMLEDFFDISRDSRAHFEGLTISAETSLCKTWMNQWPVVSLTMKSVEGLNFKDAYGMLEVVIANLCQRYRFLGESGKVDEADRGIFRKLKFQNAGKQDVKNSLLLLTRMMSAHYGKPAILLMDEYDVPLAKASENGYYTEMLDLVRALLGETIKTNPYLKFAVVTGCLRISKESIFTGVNNFVADTIAGDRFNEYIGFTPSEVHRLLADTGFSDHEEEVRQWYDGYHFGSVEVYCPWAVLNHVNALRHSPQARPRNYWANTSHNGIIYHFISRKLQNVRDQLETLMSGGVIVTPIEENLTYDYLRSSVKNFWSLLYLTGYLTSADSAALGQPVPAGSMALRIPNEEIRGIFKNAIVDWFHDYAGNNGRDDVYNALWNGDTEKAQSLISGLLFQTISFYDYEERFYHAFLTGLFAGDDYSVDSNMEYGTGRPDIVVKDPANRRALVMEVKYAKEKSSILARRREALQQIAGRRYLEALDEGYCTRTAYGITFYKKTCFIDKAN